MVRYAARHGVGHRCHVVSRTGDVGAEGHRRRGPLQFAGSGHGDYRDVRESGFDAVSSIGLTTEHIGWRTTRLFRLPQSETPAKAGGLMLNHCITRPDNKGRGEAPSSTATCFPDGELTGSGGSSPAQNVGLEGGA